METTTGHFEDFKVNIRIKLSALWTAVMFCYIYGDFFTLFLPGHIASLMNGRTGVGATTPLKLLGFAVMMTLPSIMVFLCLVLRPKLNRWINLVLGVFFTAIMLLIVASSIDEWMLFYIFLGVVEIIITSLITWYAWRWPRH
jgi:hypothetical protein